MQLNEFKVTDQIRLKRNLRKIDTYGISPCILLKHRKTVFKIRKVHEDETGQYAIRVYPYCKVFNKATKEYEQTKIGFALAYFNPEMFVKVEV